MKKLLVALLILCVCSIAGAKGLTAAFLTEQVVHVDSGNSLTVEVGYMLDGGLEPYLGTQWWPRWDEESGDLEPPGVLILGCRQHFGDILDPNSAIPFLPELLLPVINESVSLTPFVDMNFTANFLDKDNGQMGVGTGVLLKTSPDATAALMFEARYNDTFGELAGVPDNRIDFYMGCFIPF
jgi:hypothetical protein